MVTGALGSVRGVSKAWIFLLLGSMSGCTCSRTSDGGAGAASSGDAGAVSSTSGEASAPVTVGGSDPRYSAPIAAVRTSAGDIFVAGLVVSANSIELTRLTGAPVDGGRDRQVLWTRPVLSAVKWAADAELSLHALGPGLAVSWEGLRAGKAGRFVQLVTVDGEPHGEPFAIGGSACTTKSELAWPEPDARGMRILARGWDGVAHEVGRLSADREPTLACGTTKIFATGEGDDDVTLVLPGNASHGGEAGRTVRLIAAGDFPAKDEERAHELYTWGDELGVLRVGASGGLARRDVNEAMSPWSVSARPLAEDDDVEAVDADAHATYVVWTHDEDDGCGDSGASASSVHVRVLPRAAAGLDVAETDVTLAPTDCARDVGPFWTAQLGDSNGDGNATGDVVIAWAERASRIDKTSPPITALSYRRMRGTQIVEQGKVDAQADAVESAGCDANHCYAAALHRVAGTDVMAPEAARILQYP